MEKEKHTRRSFLNKLWLVLGGLAFAEIIAVTFTYFKPRKPEISPEAGNSVIVAGPVENFEPGTVSAFVRGKFYLARL